ncbi:hypothetical protein EYV94_28395, partial [Puteibacter caeruleilacunae]
MTIGLMAASKMPASTMPAAANKIDLTPKLKKGDQWKMVAKYEGFRQLITYKGPHHPQRTTKAEWLVTCDEINKRSFSFTFSLERLIAEDESDVGIMFNDTNYPTTMREEQIKEMKKILGKSISLRCDFKDSVVIEVLNNDFSGSYMTIPKIHIMKKIKTFLVNQNWSSDRASHVGEPALQMFLKSWATLIKEQSNTNLELPVFGKNQSLEINDIHQDSINTYVNMQGNEKNHQGNVTINSQTKLPVNSHFQFGDYQFDFLMYDVASSPNTLIKGIFNSSDDDDITFTIKYPFGTPPMKYKLLNNRFEIPLDLKEAIYATIKYNGKETVLFLRPGMNIALDFRKKQTTPEVSGLGKDDLICFYEYNKTCIHGYEEMSHWPQQKLNGEIGKQQNKVKEILINYAGKISHYCEDYIQTDSRYGKAMFYLKGRSMAEIFTSYNLDADSLHLKQASLNKPFFMNKIDSLILLEKICLASPTYHRFLSSYLSLKQSLFLHERGRHRESDEIDENLLFAEMYYTGYPYYYAAYQLIEEQILEGQASKLQNAINKYKSLPCLPSFSAKIDREIQEMQRLKVGQSFPYEEIVDWEGKKHVIPKDEFCFLDFAKAASPTGIKNTLTELERVIKETKQVASVNFFFIIPHHFKEFLKEQPSSEHVNLKYIYLKDNDEKYFNGVKLAERYVRIFLLDPNSRVLRNNLTWIQQGTGHDLEQTFEEYFDSLNQPTSQADNSRLWLIIVGSFLGFGLLSWLIIRIRSRQIARKEAARRKLTEMELKAIRSQMNPHFIFNAMGSIQNLINHNQIKNANLYLSRFARLMRMVLANSNKQLVTLADELELIQHYLELEQLRVDFQFSISCSDDIDPETEEIPGMLIQPLVENAVVHGLTPKGSGNVDVKFHKEHTNIICEIIDDGVGIGTHVGIGDDAGYEAVVGADAGTGTI